VLLGETAKENSFRCEGRVGNHALDAIVELEATTVSIFFRRRKFDL